MSLVRSRSTRLQPRDDGPTSVEIPRAAVRSLSRLLGRAAERGREECAVLLGRGGRRAVVERAVRVPNVARSPDAFAIRRRDLDAAAERFGLAAVGVFHTHFVGGAPSRADVLGMRAGGLVYVIGWRDPTGRCAMLLSGWRAPKRRARRSIASNRRSMCFG